MMSEVVVNTDAANRPTQFHAAPYVLEARQGVQPFAEGHTDMPCSQQSGDRIGAIVLAIQGPMRFANDGIAVHQAQSPIRIIANNVPARAFIKTLKRRPATTFEHAFETGFRGISDD